MCDHGSFGGSECSTITRSRWYEKFFSNMWLGDRCSFGICIILANISGVITAM